MKVSIRRQLLTLFLPVLFGLWIGSAVLSFVLVARLSDESFDRELINSADSLVGRLRVRNDIVSLDLPPAAQAILKHDDCDKFYYSVVDSAGKLISGDRLVRGYDNDLPLDSPRVSSSKIGGEDVRLVELRVTVQDADIEPVTVRLAQTTKSRRRFNEKMLVSIALPQLVVIGVGLFTVLYGIERILAPLRLLQRHLASRATSDLKPISNIDVPEEVAPLVNAVNQLLIRLGDEIRAQKKLIANAAHQLRTPLAGLKTYTSVGVEMTDPSDLKHVVRELDQGVDRASRMVNQLLALARSDAGESSRKTKKDHIDLNVIASDVADQLADVAERKQLELFLEPSREPAIVVGDRTGLLHLVTNLVENALFYTSAGGFVRISIKRNGAVNFSVEDTGEGIPESEREKIFERFYRVVGTPGTGSGLGLAIVKEVAGAHGARISIKDGAGGTGVVVSVDFPDPGAQLKAF